MTFHSFITMSIIHRERNEVSIEIKSTNFIRKIKKCRLAKEAFSSPPAISGVGKNVRPEKSFILLKKIPRFHVS